jgi:uncharacterized membrane protein
VIIVFVCLCVCGDVDWLSGRGGGCGDFGLLVFVVIAVLIIGLSSYSPWKDEEGGLNGKFAN